MKRIPPANSARELAFQVLYNISEKGAYANIALKEAYCGNALSVQDRAFATELIYGVQRMQGRLDHELSQLVQKGLGSLNPNLLIILRMGVYQLEFMSVKPFAAVNETVKLASKYFNPGAAALCNGVLRNYLRSREELTFPDRVKQPAQFLEAFYSYPRFMTGYMIKQWGMEQAEQFCRFCNDVNSVCIMANTLKTTVEALQKELTAAGIEVSSGKYLPDCLYIRGSGNIAELPSFRKGHFTVMEEGSALCAKALAPIPNSRVLDLCAAPGGKTSLLAIAMQDKGSIEAFDVHEHKVGLIKDNARRLRLKAIKVQMADSRSLGEQYAESADYILLDAPCTGWGVLGRKADSRFNKRYEDIAELATLSYELLCAAAGYLKKGGSMLFSTCTITKAENEDNINRFLSEHKDFELEPLESLLPYAKGEEERAAMQRGMWQILPQKQDLEGFFLCRMKKS